jgi:Uma2 family endonuclease
MEHPLSPDLALHKNVLLSEDTKIRLRNWKMLLPDRPAPTVVLEISSYNTWKNDLILDRKPTRYGRLGVKEYFVYDPHEPLVSSQTYNGNRLIGWSYIDGQPTKLEPDEQGRLWSNELESWLVPDKYYLRFYGRQNQLRLTRAEAECRAKEAAEQREATERAAKQLAWAKLRELGIDPEKL